MNEIIDISEQSLPPIASKDVAPSAAESVRDDLIGGVFKSELWGRIGWLDVKRRYRRTVFGPFWSSGTLAIYTIAVGIVGAGIFRQDVHQYLPYLSSGMIVWTLISTIILEGCNLFITGQAFFRNVKFEYSILAYALVWRNFVIFLHNLIVFALIALLLRPGVFGPTMLLAIPGVALVLINGVWIALLVGVLCLRYRDIQPIVQTVIQIWMLVTPLFWTPESLTGARQFIFVQLNPIYRLIEVIRSPLLGEIPTLAGYGAVLLITVIGWTVTYILYRRFRNRISYWS